MAEFERFEFVPPAGFADGAAYPTEPDSEEAVREQLQRPLNQIRDYLNGGLLAGMSGPGAAEKIGAAELFPGDESGANVMDKLLELRRQVVNATAGEIPPGGIVTGQLAQGSVTTAKLAPDLVIDEGVY